MANGFEDINSQWWKQVLGEYEPGQYYGSEAGRKFGRKSPKQRRFFDESFSNILQDYYGDAGQRMARGQAPMTFMQFLNPTQAENRVDPFTARYSQLPQTARGVTGMASNPRTRFLFNY